MTRSLLLLTFLLLTSACNTRGMGETCSSSNACTGDGVCLKGVCSGYSCSSDTQCTDPLVCGSVLGVQSCELECDSDADCLGEQSCTEVDKGIQEEAGKASYCM